MKYRRLLVSVCFVFPSLAPCLSPLHAQTRIMVVADPHVMGPGLLVKEGMAWQQALAGDRKMHDHSQAIFDELMAEALREKPDLLLIPGDLTKDGELLSHQYVAQRLEELLAAGIKTYVVPGNHDLGTPSAQYYNGMFADDAETAQRADFKRFYRRFGFGDDTWRDPTDGSLSYCCEPVPGLVLVCLDTGNDYSPLVASITLSTLRWAVKEAQRASDAGKMVWVMMHNPLFPHITNGEKLSGSYCTRLAEPAGDGAYYYYRTMSIREELANAGASIVISGHTHATDIARDKNHALTRSIYEISTSTTAAYPCPYRMLTLSADRSTLDISTRYITTLPGVDDFPSMARSRLQASMKRIFSQFISQDRFAELLTDAFMLHVEGNEHLAPASAGLLTTYRSLRSVILGDKSVRSLLATTQMTYDDLDALLYSMLKDTSYYDDADRRNQTDDLDITINFRTMTATTVASPQGAPLPASRRYYTLQGGRLDHRPAGSGIYIHDGKKVVIKGK